MTFLELMNALIIESGVAGSSVTTVQGTLPLEQAKLRKWIQDSWREIQTSKEKYWGFMFVSTSMIVPLNASVLQPPEFLAGEVAEWNEDSFRIADAGKGRKDSQPLHFRDYFWWRDNEGLDLTVSRRPSSITIDWSTESLIIAPPSDEIRTLYYDYWRTPQELKLDTDVPIMPKQFHDLIVGKALRRYALDESAPEVMAKADDIIKAWAGPLDRDQGTDVETVGLLWY